MKSFIPLDVAVVCYGFFRTDTIDCDNIPRENQALFQSAVQ